MESANVAVVGGQVKQLARNARVAAAAMHAQRGLRLSHVRSADAPTRSERVGHAEWSTFAIASALTGRDVDSVRAFLADAAQRAMSIAVARPPFAPTRTTAKYCVRQRWRFFNA